MSLQAFWQYVRQSQLLYYQQRGLSLDLLHTGWPGLILGALLVSVVVAFFLSIFHMIPARRHVTGLLLGIGITAAILGFATSYYSWSQLGNGIEPKLFRDTAGPIPDSDGQRSAVVALPLVVGAATLAIGVAGCLYMAIFWATSKPQKA